MADQIYLNGIDPLTGQYLIAPVDLATASQAAIGAPPVNPTVAAVHESRAQPTLGLPFGIRPDHPEEAGWGVVFHSQETDAVKQALVPLIQHRAQEVNNPAKTKTLTYNGEDFEDWLAAQGVGLGDVKPTHVPFYLLVVGDPARIPFEFTQLLEGTYAVGRLSLDSPGDYQSYAQAVVDYETAVGATNTKEVVYFGTEHISDNATFLSCEQLVKPLAQGSDGDPGVAQTAGFQQQVFTAQAATKTALLGALQRPAGQNPPALLFTASHGLGWPLNDPHQPAAQGALLCGNWKGLGFSPTPITSEFYLSAADLQSSANVRNLIAFFFACFGLGTPFKDQFTFDPQKPPAQLVPQPCFSALPKKLLSAPGGPALAVIGHVERAWATSISPPGAGSQILAFQNAVGKILTGVPLGLALADFRDRFGSFSEALTSLLADKRNGLTVDSQKIATTWLQKNDAEAYTLFGDPAIRLRPEKLQ
jgi:hypothetical protein